MITWYQLTNIDGNKTTHRHGFETIHRLILRQFADISENFSPNVQSYSAVTDHYDRSVMMSNPDSNYILDSLGHDVDRPHSLRESNVNPRGPNASLLEGSTWNPHGGSTSDPHVGST